MLCTCSNVDIVGGLVKWGLLWLYSCSGAENTISFKLWIQHTYYDIETSVGILAKRGLLYSLFYLKNRVYYTFTKVLLILFYYRNPSLD